jgi:hypothetical protein
MQGGDAIRSQTPPWGASMPAIKLTTSATVRCGGGRAGLTNTPAGLSWSARESHLATLQAPLTIRRHISLYFSAERGLA